MNKYQESLDEIEYTTVHNEDLNEEERIFDEDDVNIKTLQELVDKATPIKVLFREFHDDGFMCDRYHSGKCPVCNRFHRR